VLHDWRLILENSLTRVRTYAKYQDDELICRDVMSADDANALADRVAEERNGNDWRYKLRGSTQQHRTHIATIPAVLVNDLMRQGIWGNPERMEKWFNSPDNAMWRTGGGHVKIKEA
jgi:hypothetical protein